MAMTVLPKNVGFNPRGTSKHLWIPLADMPDGVLDTAALTAVGTVDMTNQAVTRSGFTTTQAQDPDPDQGSLVTGTIPGEVTFAESSITFRLSKTGPQDDIRAVLYEGDEGYYVRANEGITAGLSALVARCTIGYPSDVDGAPAQLTVPFIVSSVERDVTIPALV